MTTTLRKKAIGQPLTRIEGPKKVTGMADYSYEHSPEQIAYGSAVQSTIAKGHIKAIDTGKAEAIEGVLKVLTYKNAPRLKETSEAEQSVLQSDEVAYRGQFIAFVIAETLEIAQQAADAIVVHYSEEHHEAALSADMEGLFKPKTVNPNYEPDTAEGDVEAALATADAIVDQTYETPAQHNNPMEPHATFAQWSGDSVTLYDSTQGPHNVRSTISQLFDIAPENVRVISPYVGGGFGSKGKVNPNVVLTVMGAREVKRPVKFAVTRQAMFAVTGYRTPTIQHIRLGATKDGHLTAISHDVVEQTSTLKDFAEQTAVATRMMYASPNRSTSHRLARLDVPTPAWMRAPGECPGMYALESAMDELAIALAIDPVELRILNEPAVDPETGNPFSTRGLVACLREGAERFGWQSRHTLPGTHVEGRWQIGTGVAASTYPARRRPSNAKIRARHDGHFDVLIDACDIGTGALTILTQIAADALETQIENVHLEIGDSSLPQAMLAGGSMGTASWGTAIDTAALELHNRLQEEHGVIPAEGIEVMGTTGDNPDAKNFSMYSFGAQFAEVRVNMDTGEVRVSRLLGVFAAGRIMNEQTARSQFIGGMTMGLSMALHEESVMDPRFGDYVNHDFAEYHIATNADVHDIEVFWIDEEDYHVSSMGAKGIGEVGIVGTAAAIANAVYNATGIRVRDLPITLDKILQ